MSNATHTPGPWRTRRWTAKESVVVATLAGNDSDICGYALNANAALIAAAPELLEALEACRLELDYCQRQLAAHGQTGHANDSVSRALAAGAAAIAKAKGGAA